MDRNIDAVVLHPLKAADGLAEDHPRARIFIGHFENVLASTDFVSAENRQCFVQRALQSLPAAVYFTYDALCAELHIGQAHFRRADHKAEYRFYRHPRRLPVNQRKGYATA